MPATRFAVSTLTCVVLAACGPELGTEPTLATTRSSLKNECDSEDFLCGKNSADIKKYKFHELNSLGLADEKGVRFHSARRGAVPVKFLVDGVWPRAVTGGGAVFDGAQLVGTTLKIELGDGTLVDVQINDAKIITPYNGIGRMWAYRLQYLDVNGPSSTFIDVCPNATLDDQGVVGTWALLTSGDRYDRKAQLTHVGAAEVGAWFNVSCAGDVIAKLVRLKHVEGFESFSFHTSKAQRQSALHMFTANYCGDGVFYTTNGTPLRWLDSAGVTLPEDFGAFEAVWGANGAVCVSNPRHVTASEIACAPPPCTKEQMTDWASYGEFMSTLAPLGIVPP